MKYSIAGFSLVFLFVFSFSLEAGNFHSKNARKEKGRELNAAVQAKEKSCFSSVGFLSGFTYGELDSRDDYENIPFLLSYGFDLRPLASKIGINTKGVLEFQAEPFIGAAISPENDYEAGISFLLKYGFPLNKKLMPYLKVGTGPMFLGISNKEQGSEFNFIDSAALGFSWFLEDDISLDCEYRFRHVSNAGLDDPNKGIEAQTFLVGVTYGFE